MKLRRLKKYRVNLFFKIHHSNNWTRQSLSVTARTKQEAMAEAADIVIAAQADRVARIRKNGGNGSITVHTVNTKREKN